MLVDDGSTDGCGDIATSCAASHPDKIRYIKSLGVVNQGTGPARNVGLSHARGLYIAFLDSDDVWLPHALQVMIEGLESHPETGMVYGATNYWRQWPGSTSTRPDALDFNQTRGVPPGTLVQPPGLLTYFLEDSGAVPCMCSILVRRNIAEQAGGFEDSFRGLYEDQAFYMKVALAAPVLVLGGYWANYRRHDDSIWETAMRQGEEDRARLYFLNWLTRYLQEMTVDNVDVWHALKAQLWPFKHPAARLDARCAPYCAKRSAR
ncbi:MAG: glycosyltransferase family A protein [Chloroflexia bacterium]